MVAADFLAEEGGADSEGHSVARETPATSAGALDTGPSTARDEVIHSDAKQSFACIHSYFLQYVVHININHKYLWTLLHSSSTVCPGGPAC